jgi:DNA-binding NarL/FixJ family response regulator
MILTQKREVTRVVSELRILIADDHEVVRKGLKSLLGSQPGWQVVGEASDGPQTVEKVHQLGPDVVVLDITMPHLSGLEVARRVLAESPNTKLVFFTMHGSEQMVYEALNAGVHGYVLKSDAGNDLVHAVESTQLPHRFFVSPRLEPLISQEYLKNGKKTVAKVPGEVLTPREREVLQLLAEGKNSKDVATTLGITLKTVETHRANLMAKLDLHSLPGLVRYAIRNKIVMP